MKNVIAAILIGIAILTVEKCIPFSAVCIAIAGGLTHDKASNIY